MECHTVPDIFLSVTIALSTEASDLCCAYACLIEPVGPSVVGPNSWLLDLLDLGAIAL